MVISDERALVSAARNLGFVFKTRLPDCVSIEVVCTVRSSSCLLLVLWLAICWLCVTRSVISHPATVCTRMFPSARSLSYKHNVEMLLASVSQQKRVQVLCECLPLNTSQSQCHR